ncbi:rod shape-determining protein MreC [Marinilongibacter aquaticus]|uniref:rod shape-determining protein MreC n=1 Tax=Marinilongibacter aquaticus TaxID=2975157 RepID=UPI0021BD1F73|nr:rod shape-determining protein MreC [Marinilongibacter aquaticus]UBM57598.1 rod shape-determining protein MreC [Marinilongibacter aquaticus]
MSQLFRLLNRAKYFFLFVFLELICFYLISKSNVKWDVTMFNSSNAVSANVMSTTAGIKDYLHLRTENKSLVAENNQLRNELIRLVELENVRPDAFYKVDSVYADRFQFTVSKVINSTTSRVKNYITLDKGILDGIEPGMGVIGPRGVVGQVKACSDHFSVAYSILHEDFKVSVELVNNRLREMEQTALGLCSWDGRSRNFVKLNTIDRFKPTVKGDSVVTSAQNLVFPQGVLVGRVYSVTTPSNGAFHDIDVQLATDFGSLTYVYIVKNRLLEEQLSLEEGVLRDE